jgi:hypothetical protein
MCRYLLAVLACAICFTAMGKTDSTAAFVQQAKADVANGSTDPGTVQFRKLFLATFGSKPVLCGEINAKNQFGGYVGFRLFYYSVDESVREVQPANNVVFKYDFEKVCAAKVRDVR